MVIILDKKEFEKNVNKLLLLCIIITIGVVIDFLYNKSLLNLFLAIIVLICTLIIFFGKLIWKKY
jgi:ABC-type bacteriocin/lantibiotic exporter with double-glycine peptidase domain